jgi:hypothetical protein
VAGAPNDGLPRQKRDRASFMRALRAERVQFIAGLQNQYALPAHRNDDKLVLLQFGRFITSQSRRSGRTGLWQRLEITNDWISNADQPREDACAQKKIEKMATRRCRTSPGLFVHCRFFYVLAMPGSSICFPWATHARPAFVTTNTCEPQPRLCGCHARRARRTAGRGN